jgi:hypothetical protein
LLASKCLDKIYCSLIAGGHGDDKADYMDPWRGRCANIGKGLQLLYGVPPMKIRLGNERQVGDLVEKIPSGDIHEVLNGTGVQWNILERGGTGRYLYDVECFIIQQVLTPKGDTRL